MRVSWDEALADIASRWQAIAAESGAEAILPYSSAGVQGLIQEASLDRRLFGSMGCSGLDRNICGAVAAAGLSATIGCGTGIDPEEVVHSRFIVLWGTNTIVTNLHFWPLVREAQRRGAKVVVVDPIRTRTAEAADWHVQIKPASDAALALAMMHVMIRDGLVDHDYVSQHAVGYEALAERVQQYSPAQVSHTVGLPAEEIERFAREYATTQPSLLRPLIGIEHHRNGAMQFRTLACLAGAQRLVAASRRRPRTVDPRPPVRGAGHGPRADAGGIQARRPRAEHARSRRRSLQPRAAAAGCGRSSCTAATRWCRCRIRAGFARGCCARTCSPWCTTCSSPTPRSTPTTSCPPRARSSIWISRRPGGISISRSIVRRSRRAVNRWPTRSSSGAWRGRSAGPRTWLFESDESMLRAALASGHPWLEGITFERLWEEGYARLNVPGGLAAVCGRRLRDAVGQGGALFGAAPGARPRSVAVGRRDPVERRAPAHHRQDPALPQLRLQQHGASSAPHGRVVHRDPPRRCAVAGRGDWRCGARVERSRRGARRLLGLGPRAPGRRLDAVRRPRGCQWRAAIGERCSRPWSRRTGAAAAASTTRSWKWRRSRWRACQRAEARPDETRRRHRVSGVDRDSGCEGFGS